MPRVDYTGRAGAYQRARTLPPAILDVWTRAIEQLDLPTARTVLDLGAGPGGFLDVLESWSAASVLAIEPSTAMRARAHAAGLDVRHPYVAGAAEHLPLAADTVDWAWISTVIHQVDDLRRCVTELARVLRPGGCVLVRGFFSDVPVTGLFAHFPGIERSARTFPSTRDITEAFRRGGFELHRIVDVVEPWVFDRATWEAGVRAIRDTDSALRPLTDDEIDEGIRCVTRSDPTGEPLHSTMTLRLLSLRLAGATRS